MVVVCVSVWSLVKVEHLKYFSILPKADSFLSTQGFFMAMLCVMNVAVRPYLEPDGCVLPAVESVSAPSVTMTISTMTDMGFQGCLFLKDLSKYIPHLVLHLYTISSTAPIYHI